MPPTNKPTTKKATKEKPLPHNGVAISSEEKRTDSFRTYEVYQRERLGESTEKIQPGDLTGPQQLTNPYPVLEVLREHYPCYRDWSGNAYWLTRYNDVTSVFSDRANFAVPSRARACGLNNANDLSETVAAHRVWADLIDNELPGLCATLCDDLLAKKNADLSIDYGLRLCNELQRKALGIAVEHQPQFERLMWHIQRADSWRPDVAAQGTGATTELLQLLNQTQADATQFGLRQELEKATAADLLATVLSFEARTLHGWIANLAHAWLTNPATEAHVRTGRAELKVSALEAMRYTPPVTYAHCRARHEVERFGRLLPEGALLRLSAQAANRDPRVFNQPDTYIPGRQDICHREARGQYRADGLATGIAFGLGLPSKHPAVPEDRPRSLYALTRDATITATHILLQHATSIKCTEVPPVPHALAAFEPMIAWSLPVSLS